MINNKCPKCGFALNAESPNKCIRCGTIVNCAKGCSGNCLKCSAKKGQETKPGK